MIPVSQGVQTPRGPAHAQLPQQLSMQQQEALRAAYLQRAGQASQATSTVQAYQPNQAPGMPVSQAGSPLRRWAFSQPAVLTVLYPLLQTGIALFMVAASHHDNIP